ncbi:lrr receptor-like serine threonine-protein kinase fls2 [Hordeum vulgare]|nr:lrr receptor-like serine threonine-protein kinase fls2 [Hordeum vulgare]
MGKIMSEKLAHPDVVCLSLGRVWCPIKGISCREVGENVFLITFHQELGKRKALDNGPWMFDKDLVVVEEFDPSKRIEDYAFNNIPIWVRVFNLPLGMMNLVSAEEIGNIIGQFVEPDTGSDGSAIGRFMRVKIKMCIDTPIIRGFTLEDDEGDVEKRSMLKGKEKVGNMKGDDEEGGWCRFEYEFLPDFCYTCGRIGHGEKDCATKLQKGDTKKSYGFNKTGGRTGSGSESLSWRKSDSRSSGEGQAEIGGTQEGKEHKVAPDGSKGQEVGSGEGTNPERRKYKKIQRKDQKVDDEQRREMVIGHKRSRVEDALLELGRKEDPDVLFLAETKLSKKELEKFRWLLGLANMIAWNPEGRSRGIVMFWRRGVDITLRTYGRRHVDVDVKEDDGRVWRLTGMYGESATERKMETW